VLVIGPLSAKLSLLAQTSSYPTGLKTIARYFEESLLPQGCSQLPSVHYWILFLYSSTDIFKTMSNCYCILTKTLAQFCVLCQHFDLIKTTDILVIYSH